MNELIPIQYENEKPTVSKKKKHTALEIGSEYAK